MSYVDFGGCEIEDSEMDAMREDAREAAKEAQEAATVQPAYKLVIFDYHNTLVNTDWIDHQPLHVLPGRADICAALRAQGVHLAIASNQGGVAFGIRTPVQIRAEIEPIARSLGIEHWRTAFGHPSPKYGFEEYATKQELFRRKPGPGMLLELVREADVMLSETLMVGDLAEDQGAAAAAGVDFIWTQDYFGNPSEVIGRIYMCLLALAEKGRADYMVVRPDGTGYLEKEGRDVELALTWKSLRQAPLVLQAALLKDDLFDAFLDADDLP